MPSRSAQLRAALAVTRAAVGTMLSRRRPEPPPADIAPPRRLAHPCAVTVPVNATADQVFEVLADPARMPDWLLQHAGWIGGRPGDLTDGVRFRQRIKLMGVPSEVRWTVVGRIEGRAIFLEGAAPMGITVGLFLSVTPAEPAGARAGAVVRFDGGVEGGSTDGPLGPMLARNLADAMRRSLTELGSVARQHAGPGSGAHQNPAHDTVRADSRRDPDHGAARGWGRGEFGRDSDRSVARGWGRGEFGRDPDRSAARGSDRGEFGRDSDRSAARGSDRGEFGRDSDRSAARGDGWVGAEPGRVGRAESARGRVESARGRVGFGLDGAKPAPVRWERTGVEIDAWTPVIVGAGQEIERSVDVNGGDPVSLAVRALRSAAEDAGVAGILAQADLAGYVASVSWQYQDGAALLAEAVGANPRQTVQTTIFGGDGSLRLLNDVAAEIAAGRASIALVGGAEAAATAAAAERAERQARPEQGQREAPETRQVPENGPRAERGFRGRLWTGRGVEGRAGTGRGVEGRARTGRGVEGGARTGRGVEGGARTGAGLDWPVRGEGTEPTRTVGDDSPANNDPETAAGLVAPILLYALIESAVRGRLGLAPAEHLDRISRLWSGFSEIAAGNPHAWRPGARTPEDLATPSASNRMIAAPYPKLLTADLQVNQGTGIIVCSAAAATEAGVPQDRWVFVHAGAHANDEWFVTERADLASSPAIRAVGEAVLGHAGVTIGEVGHVDLYACFPSAVQIAAHELGLPVDDPARLTVTGGLTFAGGPGNNYASHAIANLVPRLRADQESFGLATAVGWYLTKHAATVLSARPPRRDFRDIDAGPRLPRPPARRARSEWHGPAVLEAYTIPYERDGGPTPAMITALTPSGDRIVLKLPEFSEMSQLLAESDPIGWRLQIDGNTFTITDTTPVDLPPPPEPPLLIAWHGPVTVITLNRPEVRNAIDLHTAKALEKALDDFEADDAARVAVLTGSDTVFSSGMDLKAAARGEYPVTEGRGLLGITARPPAKPLIAAVEGAALAGGCELALSADLIVAAEDAAFGIPEVKRGLVAAAGGVLRFAQNLPRSTALELALTGEPMPARRLHELGLINRVTSPGKALSTALELAHDIAANAPLAVLLSKRIVDEHRDWGAAEAFDHLSDIAGRVIGSADAREGIRAFAENRAPQWKGR
ncbi:crotonase/enoyl-CoA hydratase family protein [Actinoplanes sp. G11-F43]|uniref:crotonase/enoyl-CoA hydratase family protein n=1 Tax=Actinoplanes sp. G11-F43 TaxID=3424130 RepID=UPI003D3273F0